MVEMELIFIILYRTGLLKITFNVESFDDNLLRSLFVIIQKILSPHTCDTFTKSPNLSIKIS